MKWKETPCGERRGKRSATNRWTEEQTVKNKGKNQSSKATATKTHNFLMAIKETNEANNKTDKTNKKRSEPIKWVDHLYPYEHTGVHRKSQYTPTTVILLYIFTHDAHTHTDTRYSSAVCSRIYWPGQIWYGGTLTPWTNTGTINRTMLNLNIYRYIYTHIYTQKKYYFLIFLHIPFVRCLHYWGYEFVP